MNSKYKIFVFTKNVINVKTADKARKPNKQYSNFLPFIFLINGIIAILLNALTIPVINT